jgi:hypothetical protein
MSRLIDIYLTAQAFPGVLVLNVCLLAVAQCPEVAHLRKALPGGPFFQECSYGPSEHANDGHVDNLTDR